MKTSLPKSSYDPQTLPQRIRQQYAMVRASWTFPRSEFCGQQEQILVNPKTGDYRTNKQYNNPQIGNLLHPLSETQNQNTSKREPISIWETKKKEKDFRIFSRADYCCSGLCQQKTFARTTTTHKNATKSICISRTTQKQNRNYIIWKKTLNTREISVKRIWKP